MGVCQRLLVVRYELAWQPCFRDENEVELAAQIKRHRTEKGLSQEDLAAKIYVSRQTVSNWETDKTYPDVESLLLLSVLFDVTIDELIKGDVEAMKDALSNDSKKMNTLALGGTIVALAGVALFFGGFFYWKWDLVPSAVIFLLVYGIGMAMLVKVERIKKCHDLVTYREVLAFSKGEPIDRDNSRSQRARQHRVLKGIILTLIAAVAGGALGYCAARFGLLG